MRTVLPEKWCIECTEENKDILQPYRLTLDTEWRKLTDLLVGYTLISRHDFDSSYFYTTNIKDILSRDLGFEELTIEEFQLLVLNQSITDYEIY